MFEQSTCAMMRKCRDECSYVMRSEPHLQLPWPGIVGHSDCSWRCCTSSNSDTESVELNHVNVWLVRQFVSSRLRKCTPSRSIVSRIDLHSISLLPLTSSDRLAWSVGNNVNFIKLPKYSHTPSPTCKLFTFGIDDRLLCDRSSTCSRVSSLKAREWITCSSLFDTLMHLGDENLLNSLTMRRTWPSVTTNESSRFQYFCEKSSSSTVALCTCKLIQ